jgi:hypothetical protein
MRDGRPEGAWPSTPSATILAIPGLLRPLSVDDLDSAVPELVLRASQLVALLFLFDGPLVPEAQS